MHKKFGVKVRLLEEDCCGYIVRRLNSESYEIATEDERIFILSPKEFEEVDEEN